MIDIKEHIKSPEYNFLKTDEHLGKRIILLTLGGSYAYGTNKEDGTSDVDVRGIAVNSPRELLTNCNFEQFVNEETDTTIYSLKKIVTLLSNCNPNTIELLGCRPEHYCMMNDIGKSLIANKDMFLSKRAIYSFGGYANQQLRRLENATIRDLEQTKREEHIYKTMTLAFDEIAKSYTEFPFGSVKLSIDKAINPEMDTEIFIDVDLKHYPLRDYTALHSELHSIVKSYNKIGKRNEKALQHEKIGKHCMHLIRLYLMCLDILEKGEIVTYREKEHDLLMDIRNGKYLDGVGVPIPEFYEMVDDLENKLEYAKKHSELPEKPNYERINDWLYDTHKKVILDDQF